MEMAEEFQVGNLSFLGYVHLLFKTLNINSLDLATERCPIFFSEDDHFSSVEWFVL